MLGEAYVEDGFEGWATGLCVGCVCASWSVPGEGLNVGEVDWTRWRSSTW